MVINFTVYCNDQGQKTKRDCPISFSYSFQTPGTLFHLVHAQHAGKKLCNERNERRVDVCKSFVQRQGLRVGTLGRGSKVCAMPYRLICTRIITSRI